VFYATYASGLGEPVGRLLNGRGCTVRLMLDGAVVYERREVKAAPPLCDRNSCQETVHIATDGHLRRKLESSSFLAHAKAAPPRKFVPAFNNVYEVLVCEKWSGRSLDGFMKKVFANGGADGGAWKKRLRFNTARSGQPNRSDNLQSGNFQSGIFQSGNFRSGNVRSDVFRIVTSVENKLVSVNGTIKTQFEDIIASATGLTPDRGGNGYEYLFLLRSEGYAFFLKRLTYHKAHEKVLQKGELRPELCYMLHYLSEPVASDRVLDPFCGCGSIAAARVRHFPCRAVYASDTDLRRLTIPNTGLIKQTQSEPRDKAAPPLCYRNSCQETVHNAADWHLRRKLESSSFLAQRKTLSVVYREADIGALDEWLPPASIDKIVTDPPWGIYDAGLDIAELYAVMFGQFERVLTDDGVIVLLTAQKELVHKLLRGGGDFCLSVAQAYDILVSGKKAGVFVIKKHITLLESRPSSSG
jgi:predicted RNA methylase